MTEENSGAGNLAKAIWIPAFAGMTEWGHYRCGNDGEGACGNDGVDARGADGEGRKDYGGVRVG